MSKFIYLETKLYEDTTYKSIKAAIKAKKIVIVYYPRENVYYFGRLDIPDKTVDLVKAELERLFPGIRNLKD